ncbi:hypothetical protein U1Q18_013440, partial [Sarracenia purpurea var. burkii]
EISVHKSQQVVLEPGCNGYLTPTRKSELFCQFRRDLAISDVFPLLINRCFADLEFESQAVKIKEEYRTVDCLARREFLREIGSSQ